MKARNRKIAASLLLSVMVLGTGVVSASAAETVTSAAQVSGISLLVAQAETQEAASMGVAQVDSYLNVRSEASTDSEIVGIMDNNAVAEITGEQDGWYQITSGNISGYVKAEYLTVGNQELLNSVKTRLAQVNADTLRVRSEASTESSVLTLVGLDDQLMVLDEQTEGWVKVKTGDTEGYVSSEFVTVADTYQYAKEPEDTTEGSGGSAVISYAMQFLGNPYVWGGTSLTNGVDCSGFVMQVYAHYGISLPHSSAALRGAGTGVSYSEAQPGDIICYSGHVALYIGGGQIIHASNPSDGIKISSATYRNILAVRRVLN